jgi:sugar-specific transcriptional regulator TrmB
MEKNKNVVILLIIVIVCLSVGLVFMVGRYSNMKAEAEDVQTMLEGEKTRLTGELGNTKMELESLKSSNDSMNTQIEKQQTRIEKLLKMNASNFEKIKLYESELGTLREVMKSYVIQIDSLNTRNQILMAENSDVKDKLEDARKKTKKLEDEKSDLSSKVDVASSLSAKNVVVIGLNKRGNEVEKISKIVKLKVCCTIRENSIAKAGDKTIYVRISRPDNLLLVSSAEEIFEFDGQKLPFTAKRTIQYENKDIEVCIYWDNNNNLIAGNYTVDIFSDGKLIGSNTFLLK